MKFLKINSLFVLCFLLLFSLALAACGAGETLLSDVTADAGTLNLANGVNVEEPKIIAYRVGQPAKVSISLAGGTFDKIYTLRQDEERSPGSYQLLLTGAIDSNENGLIQTRLLPGGAYRYTISAQTLNNGAKQEVSGDLQIINSYNQPPPLVDELSATPAVISPNFDAREDTSQLNWRTSQPATVTVSITGQDGFSKVLKNTKNQPAQQDRTLFNGLDQRGEPLTDGVYTYTVQAADNRGNVSRASRTVEVKGGGKPTAVVQQVSIAPTEIIRGNLITVTVRVRNTGTVPIRSQGPTSGFVYSTNEVYSSIEAGKYQDSAGFWRVGVDYESNSGSGASRYPFRWGWEGELAPGNTVDIVGVIKVERNEQKLRFYVGLIQEQIALPQDRLQITEVKISY